MSSVDLPAGNSRLTGSLQDRALPHPTESLSSTTSRLKLTDNIDHPIRQQGVGFFLNAALAPVLITSAAPLHF